MSSFIESPPAPASTVPAPGARSEVEGDHALRGEAFDFTKTPDKGGGTLAEITHGQPVADWLKKLLAQEDEIVRMTGFMRLLDALETPEQIQEALAVVLHREGGSSRSREFRMLLQKWAQLNPADAMKYTQEIKDGGNKYEGSRTVLTTWMRQSAQEAIGWAEKNGGNEDEKEGNWAMSIIVSQLSKTDVDWALRLALAQGVSRARGRTLDSLVPALMAQKGNAAAREIALNLPDQSLRDAMIAQLAGRLADRDPQGTAAWVSGLPPGDMRKRAFSAYVGELSRKDPVAAAGFLERQPASPETDDSRAILAYNVLRKDPESAMAWAGSITDEQGRAETVAKLIESWLRRDGDTAKKWITASPLPEDMKAKYLTAPAPTADRKSSGRGGR